MLANKNTEEVKGGNGGYLDTAKRAQHGQGELAGELADDAEVRGARLLASLWCVEVVDEMNVGTESWVASMRPSADDLNAGAAFIDSDELEANANMLRFIGELSVSQMLGEKAGSRPGTSAATDAAWTYAEENTNRLSILTAGAVAAAPPERKDDVRHLLTWLTSPLGLRYLRAFARELRRATTASPHAAVTDVPADAAPVNWSACWAWYMQHLSHRMNYRVFTPYSTLRGRDRHIAAEPYSKVYVVGRTLLGVVSMLVQSGYLVPWRETVCPIDLETDYFTDNSVAWCSIHPCMHWCCDPCLRKWMVELKKDTCPVCRTKITFALPAVRLAPPAAKCR